MTCVSHRSCENDVSRFASPNISVISQERYIQPRIQVCRQRSSSLPINSMYQGRPFLRFSLDCGIMYRSPPPTSAEAVLKSLCRRVGFLLTYGSGFCCLQVCSRAIYEAPYFHRKRHESFRPSRGLVRGRHRSTQA